MSSSEFGEATRTNVTVAQGLLNSPHLASGIRKATFRLMPMLIILYFVAFLDRTNVGFAEAAMEVDRGISARHQRLDVGTLWFTVIKTRTDRVVNAQAAQRRFATFTDYDSD